MKLYGQVVFTTIAIIINIPVLFLFNKFLPILIGKNIIRPLKIVLDLNYNLDEQSEIPIVPKDKSGAVNMNFKSLR